MLDLKKMTSERGEISKSDLVVYIKQSKMWKGIMESKSKTCSQSQPISKVNQSESISQLSNQKSKALLYLLRIQTNKTIFPQTVYHAMVPMTYDS